MAVGTTFRELPGGAWNITESHRRSAVVFVKQARQTDWNMLG
jgi:hypothetical protein